VKVSKEQKATSVTKWTAVTVIFFQALNLHSCLKE